MNNILKFVKNNIRKDWYYEKQKQECKNCSKKDVIDKKIETTKNGLEYYKDVESKKDDE